MNVNDKGINTIESLKRLKNFWDERTAIEFRENLLYADFKNEKDNNNVIYEYEIKNNIFENIKNISKNNDLLIYITMLAGLQIQINSYVDKSFVINVPVYKGNTKTEQLCNSWLPLKCTTNKDELVSDLINNCKMEVMEVYKNQNYPLEEIYSQENDKKTFNFISQIFFSMTNIHSKEHIEEIKNIDKNFININIKRKDDYITISIEFNSREFELETIKRLIKNYELTLENMLSNVKNKVKDIISICDYEINLILKEFNNTKTQYPRDKSVKELFEEIEKKYPNNIAIVSGDKKITYKQLNMEGNKLANFLKEKGVKKGDIISLVCDKSIETVVGILGIVKSGAAYMPIDKEYPEQRIEYMIKDANSKIILGNEYSLNQLNLNDVDKIIISDISNLDISHKNINENNSPEDLIYVMYTSGSTGEPKGVCVENKNVIRLVKNTNYVKFNHDDKILQTGSLAFDAATFEIWGSLLNGLELHIESKSILFDTSMLKKYLEENNITICWFTSALFNQLCKENINIFKPLRYLMTGGDIVSSNNVSKLKEIHEKLIVIDGYGPTENTTFSTTYTIDGKWNENFNIPIGKPIANSTCYIMDKNQNLLPIGIAGELCVGGDGVARGYLNKEEITNEKFIENPYVKGERIYKTGDLARWLPNGNIEFLGRIDKQVKIRGFRIELDEIEKVILKCEGILESVVIDRKNKDGEKYLCGYITSNEKINTENIKKQLKSKLPRYMIPSYIMQIKEMPLNINGKVDVKRLLKEEGIKEDKIIVNPKNEIEEKIVKVWSEVLGVERVSINDNFLDIGGDSLKAINVVSKLRKELGVKIEVVDIFNEKTLEEIAADLEISEDEEYYKIEPVKESEYYKTSSAQKRMYAINQMDKESLNYNMPYVMSTKDEVDTERIQYCINEIIRRHEALRTTFHAIDGEVVQKIHSDVQIKVETMKADILIENKREIDSFVKTLIKPFDLEKLMLVRSSVVNLKNANILFIDMHHIISDGVSFEIFMKELNILYKGNKIDYVPVQYKDFAHWQNKMQNNGVLNRQEEYWVNQFNGEIPVLNMPTDFKRPKIQSFNGDHLSVTVKKELRDTVNELMAKTGTSKHMIYLSALSVILSKYTTQEDIIIGTPSAGRTHAELENTLGMFINTLAIRSYPKDNKTFNELLNEMKMITLKASENQDYQFDKLIDKINISREKGRNPLFDIMFTSNNFAKSFERSKKKSNNDFQMHEPENKVAKFDLTIIMSDNGVNDVLTIEYCTDLFKKSTICRFINQYICILEKLINSNSIPLKNLDLIEHCEREQILFEFNDTAKEYPRNKSINEIFEEIVEENKEKTAIVSKDKKIKYEELNTISNNIGAFLRSRGIERNDVVSIICDKSIDTVIGILGIVKSGGAYLPIDEEYPQDRIEYMINDSKSKIIIGKNEQLNKIRNTNLKCELIDIENLTLLKNECNSIKTINDAEDLIHIIYTSGSTGEPKGVCIKHRNVVRLVKNNELFEFTNNDRILQTGSIAFDASTLEIWGTLLNGACIYIEDKNIILDSDKITKYLDKNEISIMFLTAALFEQMSKEDFGKFVYLKCLITGGDVVSPKAVSDILKKNNKIKIIDAYGPTENGVISTAFEVCDNWDENKIIPIGKPISNSTCYIFDKNNKLLPIGAVGEICVGGDGVAAGYLFRSELTKEKFIKNPYNKKEIIYKTGDMGRYLEDGTIEFKGRLDNQVKIRGFRIEMGEIETTLLKNKEIQEAVVIYKEEVEGNKYLCAFIVGEHTIDIQELKINLRNLLPHYMVPTVIVQIDKILVNANGKVDKKYLQEIEITQERDLEHPRNIIELKMLKAWDEILHSETIDINDNFFEIGGNSLLVIKLTNSIKKELKIILPISEIYIYPTIKSLSSHITKNIDKYEKIEHDFDDNVILMKKGLKTGKNLFFIPDGTGDVSTFINVINKINDDYTCWGIMSDSFVTYGPQNITIEEESEKFYDKIKKIQNCGPYNIVAFCYGAYITTEIVKKLESLNEDINKILLIDSIPMKLNNNKLNELYGKCEKFSVKREIEFINNDFKGLKYDENIKEVEEFWNKIISLNEEISDKDLQLIKENIHPRFIVSRNDFDTIDFKKLIKHINTIRSNENATFLYKNMYNSQQINSKLYFIKASENLMFKDEFENWKDIYVNKAEFLEVKGTHFSIMKDEGAGEISNVINNIFQ